MDHMILDELGALEQIAQDAGVVGDRDAQRIFDCSHGADRMDCGSDAADSLGKDPGVAWIAAR